MKLQQREIYALAQEIKARDEKEAKAKQEAFKVKFIPEAKKWVTHLNKLPKVLKERVKGYNFSIDADTIANYLAKEDKNWPQAKLAYSADVERVIVLSMIDAKDIAEIIEKVKAYKF